MRLNAKRVLLIEPDEFQALIFADLNKNYEFAGIKNGRWTNTLDFFPGCDIDLSLEYEIEFRIFYPKRRSDDPEVKFYDYSTKELLTFYGGDEIEHIILWTESQYQAFIDALIDYGF